MSGTNYFVMGNQTFPCTSWQYTTTLDNPKMLPCGNPIIAGNKRKANEASGMTPTSSPSLTLMSSEFGNCMVAQFSGPETKRVRVEGCEAENDIPKLHNITDFLIRSPGQ